MSSSTTVKCVLNLEQGSSVFSQEQEFHESLSYGGEQNSVLSKKLADVLY